MSIRGGPDIIEDGLVLHLDAADKNSYPLAGNIWYDLSGNENHATLYNSPTYNNSNGGCFSFDGSNTYCQSTTVRCLGPNTIATVEFVARSNSDATVVANPRTGAVHGYGYLFLIGSGIRYTTICKAGVPYGYSMNTSKPVTTSEFNHGSLSYSIPDRTYTGNISGNALINGEYETISVSAIIDVSSNYTDIAMGRRYNYIYGDYYDAIDVSLLRIYNRQLTQAEQLQNYNATKGRFGL